MQLGIAEIILGILTAGGGAAVVAFGLFQFLGRTWMESLFAGRVEAFRHENAKELQSLKAKIDGSLSATMRFQEKEFAALSVCWESLNSAYGRVLDYANTYQQYEDIGRMPLEMRPEYLETLDLFESQRAEILNSSDPTATLIRYVDTMKLNLARLGLQKYANTIYMNEIFIDESTAEDFKRIMSALRDVTISKEVAKEGSDAKMSAAAADRLLNEVLPEIEAMAPKLRNKFFDRV